VRGFVVCKSPCLKLDVYESLDNEITNVEGKVLWKEDVEWLFLLDHKRNLAKNTFPQSFLFALGGLDEKLEIPKSVSVENFTQKQSLRYKI
jgi:hypothetical protein